MLCMALGGVPFLSYPIHKFNALDQLSSLLSKIN